MTGAVVQAWAACDACGRPAATPLANLFVNDRGWLALCARCDLALGGGHPPGVPVLHLHGRLTR